MPDLSPAETLTAAAKLLHQIIAGVRAGFRALTGDPNPTTTPEEALTRARALLGGES